MMLGHSHHHGNRGLADTDRGIRALKVSLLVLGLTAAAEAVVVWFTGNACRFSPIRCIIFRMHLVAVPLWFAFPVSKKKPTASYPYGFYRIEDVVGLGVLLFRRFCFVSRSLRDQRRLVSARQRSRASRSVDSIRVVSIALVTKIERAAGNSAPMIESEGVL